VFDLSGHLAYWFILPVWKCSFYGLGLLCRQNIYLRDATTINIARRWLLLS